MFFKFEQTCKRAENLINYLNNKKYVITQKGRFVSEQREVNCFGHALQITNNPNKILEVLLDMDKISTEDYELLAFYDDTDEVEDFFFELDDRHSEGFVSLSENELKLINLLGNFIERGDLPKEEYLEETWQR